MDFPDRALITERWIARCARNDGFAALSLAKILIGDAINRARQIIRPVALEERPLGAIELAHRPRAQRKNQIFATDNYLFVFVLDAFGAEAIAR